MRQLLFLPPHNNLIHRIPLVHHIIILERGLLHNRAQLSKKIDFGLGERGIWCKKKREDGRGDFVYYPKWTIPNHLSFPLRVVFPSNRALLSPVKKKY